MKISKTVLLWILLIGSTVMGTIFGMQRISHSSNSYLLLYLALLLYVFFIYQCLRELSAGRNQLRKILYTGCIVVLVILGGWIYMFLRVTDLPRRS